jgi:hypothetical protein
MASIFTSDRSSAGIERWMRRKTFLKLKACYRQLRVRVALKMRRKT